MGEDGGTGEVGKPAPTDQQVRDGLSNLFDPRMISADAAEQESYTANRLLDASDHTIAQPIASGTDAHYPEAVARSNIGCLTKLFLVLAVFVALIVTGYYVLDIWSPFPSDTTASDAPGAAVSDGSPSVDGGSGEAGAGGGEVAANGPSSGSWEVTNEAGTMRCGGTVAPMAPTAPQVVDLTVLDGGERIVVTGLGDAAAPAEFTRTGTSPATYVGTLTVVDPQGAFEFTFTMVFDGQRHFSGELTGQVAAGGASCVAQRPAQGNFVSSETTHDPTGDPSGPSSDPDADIVTGVEVVPDDGFVSCEVGERTKIDDPVARATPRDALRAYLDGQGPFPPEPPPYIELRRGDGAVFYGWEQDGALAGVLEIGPVGDQVAVVAIVEASCPQAR